MNKKLEDRLLNENEFDSWIYLDGNNNISIFDRCPDRVKQIILEYLIRFSEISDGMFKCLLHNGESPIEQILFTAFEIYMTIEHKTKIYLLPQIEVESNNQRYRVDFLYDENEWINTEMKTGRKIIIECDGYEFHQKTKEQVQYDNEREYNLKMKGFEIIRFSGSQIYNQPMKCAEDLYNFITRKNKEE